MATDKRGHEVPTGASPARRQSLLDLSLTINDIVLVANETARTAKVLDLAPTSSRPAFVYQLDTAELWVHTASTGAGRPFHPRARYWRQQRTAQSAVVSTTDWATGLVTINLPADAPAGVYVARGVLFAFISGSGEISINRSVFVGSSEVDTNLRDQPVQMQASANNLGAPFEVPFAHSGGAVAVRLDGRTGTPGASWAARAATYMVVEYKGAS